MDGPILDTSELTKLDTKNFVNFSLKTLNTLGHNIVPALEGIHFEQPCCQYGIQLAWIRSADDVRLIPIDKSHLFLSHTYQIKRTRTLLRRMILALALIVTGLLSINHDGLNQIGALLTLILFFTFVSYPVRMFLLKDKLKELSRHYGITRLNEETRDLFKKQHRKQKIKLFAYRFVLDSFQDLLDFDLLDHAGESNSKYIASYILNDVIDSYKNKLIINSA